MKNEIHSSIFIAFCLVIFSFIFNGCSESPLDVLGSGKYPDEKFDYNDISIYLNSHDFIAKISFTDNFMTSYDSNFLFDTGENYQADAQFKVLDSNHVFAGIEINNYKLKKVDSIPPFSYMMFGYGNPKKNEGMSLNFGSGINHLKISANNLVPEVDTNISFLPPMVINDVKNGDTISAKNNFTIKWTGITDGYINISITQNPLSSYHNPDFHESQVLTKNDGEFTLLKKDFDYTTEDWYYLTFTRTESYIINLTNGKKIMVYVNCAIQKVVYIKH